MASYMSQSALQDFIRELAAAHCPGIAAVLLDPATGFPNWQVFRVDSGTVNRNAARESVEEVVAINMTIWVMVNDDDERDGRSIGFEPGRRSWSSRKT